MSKYNPKKIEKKWQTFWQTSKTFAANDKSKKDKKYVLFEFPYPSGKGLHVGHLRPYVASDIYQRYFRLRGYEVLYPMGWDAFGLPAENFAIKHGIHPAITVKRNIANAKKQMQSWGLGLDWSREINTTDPEYYKWTQWIFIQLFKAGLAYEATGLINWCPNDKTGLANEEVLDGKCERCGSVIEKRELRQWYLKITAYAEKLLQGLKEVNWPKPVKTQQENWIGKKIGINITYKIENSKQAVTVFTTRPDTNFGATFVVIGPEHPLVATQDKLDLDAKTWKAVQKYKDRVSLEAEEERLAENKVKSGVFTGKFAINGLNNYRMPIYVADYVLGHVGTGAVVGVPGHDKRDFGFAKVFKLPVIRVVQKDKTDNAAITSIDQVQEDEGVMVNSGFLNGLDIHKATSKMMDHLEKKGWGKRTVTYKMRDWVFSRQRYWGEPIPLVHCDSCGVQAVPEKELPVLLPKVKKYEPTGTGESPLAAIAQWVNVKCPNCKGPAKRETNTMPQWAGSSWYWLRYADPKNAKAFADRKKLEFWQPVDVYFGGMEHTTLHLLYSRFWNQFLFDIGAATVSEPFTQRVPHGIILGPDNEKMSKSRGNIVNPDDIIKEYSADTLRMYEMFLGPHESQVAWSDKGVIGVKRFLDKFWQWSLEVASRKAKKDSEVAEKALHKLIKKVGEDIEAFRFNTAIASFMEFLNGVKDETLSLSSLKKVLIVLHPFAPHVTEELASQIFKTKQSLQKDQWPLFDEKILQETTVEIIVQVNGKMRGKIAAAKSSREEDILPLALEVDAVQRILLGVKPKKVIFVPGRLINIVM